ncbi:hypothetical protein IE53DRAFT_324750 [Violaceomyces palustris]|uniref:Uncharacterized protein n=1 Tax=Violaceomyces palustris TaxID=1673888 RepID=A0ACD0P5Y0_9BASI|nr:hypothetical protein IE53DRAFT_324750 [Violaceomyces palustris]
MFAPMSKGSDEWQANDDPAASLKPGRFRAYLGNQSHLGQSPTHKALPFSRDNNFPFPRSQRHQQRTPNPKQPALKGNNGKGKGKAKPRSGDDSDLSSDNAAPKGLGARFAALAKRKKKGTEDRDQTHQHDQVDDLYEQHHRAYDKARRGILQPAYDYRPLSGASASSFGATDPFFGSSNITDFQRSPARKARGARPNRNSFLQTEHEREERERRSNRGWLVNLFRPRREVVEDCLDSWWKRWFVLAVVPSLVLWFWCAVPFPKTDPYDPNLPWCKPDGDKSDEPNPPWCYPGFGLHKSSLSLPPTLTEFFTGLIFRFYNLFAPWITGGEGSSPPKPDPDGGAEHLTVDANFWFFLFFYYGIYVAVALVYITQLFSLYRLNWWPAALGAKTSYTFFWLLSLGTGYVLHRLDPFGTEQKRNKHGQGSLAGGHQHGHHHSLLQREIGLDALAVSSLGHAYPGNGTGIGGVDESDIQWQRKTLWVGLAFATMSMPAFVCLIGLRRSGRQKYRYSLTDTQKTFLSRQLSRRIPSSYIRFLWFMSSIGLALFALMAGQGYASVYLSTLPHTGLDGVAYVTFWTITVNGLALLSNWILEEKIRSRALVFVFRYYYFLVYFIFYRNLFARLRSVDQFALVQLLSSFWVCIWHPFSMSSFCHRVSQYFNPKPKSWEEYVESLGLSFYLRNLAQNVTMLAFLGWVSILHFGSNQQLYPFFAYDNKHDPYNYRLTILGSLAIWGSELMSSFVARMICKYAFSVDITNLGLDEMRSNPEILSTNVWTSIHVQMDMLLFLIKLNFR